MCRSDAGKTLDVKVAHSKHQISEQELCASIPQSVLAIEGQVGAVSMPWVQGGSEGGSG